MGWVGVAVLIATTCFLLYRHPLASWTPESARAVSTPEKESPPRATEGKGAVPDPATESQPSVEEDEGAEEAQTTPKASASNPPALEVPTFQLDDNRSDNEAPLKGVQPNAHKIPNGPMSPPSSSSSPTITIRKNDPRTTSRPSATDDAALMPPPPPPSRLRQTTPQKQPTQNALSLTAGRYPPQLGGKPEGNSTLAPPPSAAASFRVPQGSRPTSSNTLSPTPLLKPPKKPSSKRPVLEPGYSQLDWATLTSNPSNKLRGANLPPTLIKVTPSMLKAHNGRKGTDAWTSYQGKVYNITPYVPFHPGGRGELLRGAGKDSAKLFMEIHPWVNWEAILGECLVGILVSENDMEAAETQLDAMD